VAKDRLDCWKEIASYLKRDVRTVQRWERDFGLPVQRLPGGPKAGVFAMRAELDRWLKSNPESRGGHAAGSAPRRRRILWAVCGACGLILLAVLAYGFAVAHNPQMLILQNSQFTPFATSSAVQICAAWSPDGKSIAFIGRASGFPQLFVQGIDSSSPAAITGPEVTLIGGADPVWCRAPFWSPDSQWLYFFGASSGKAGILRVSAGGGQAASIQAGAVAGTISPDGKTLVFLAQSPEDRKLRVWTASPPEGQRRLYEPVPIEASSFSNIPLLAFAPDGKKILSMLTVKPDTAYRLLPWPPGPSRRIFAKAERAVGAPGLAWMPDSRHLVFSAETLLGMADAQSGRYWPIAIQHQPMRNPTVSPDGSRVAYQSGLSHADVIAVLLDGGPIRTLLGSMRTEQEPAASPVAPQVVYVTDKRSRSAEIWIKDLAQGWDRPLVSPRDVRVRGEEAQLLLAPVFSPDGRRVAFTAISPAGSAIFTVPAAGGSPVRARGGAEMWETAPTWSPDGEWLAFRSLSGGQGRLVKVRLGSAGPVEEIAAGCMGNVMPEWSPTGEWIAFLGAGCQTILVSPDGKTTRPLGGSGVVAWARDGKTLYRVDPDKHALIAVDIATGTGRVLRDVGDLIPYSGPQPGLRASLTSDGSSIVYSVLRPREEIWVMENVRIQEPWYAWLLPLGRR
jgi:Tol biopolymer transport system component